MNAILERLRQPSTWAGVAALAAALGWQLPAETYGLITQAVMALAGLAAVVLNERNKPTPAEGLDAAVKRHIEAVKQ